MEVTEELILNYKNMEKERDIANIIDFYLNFYYIKTVSEGSPSRVGQAGR